MVDASLAAKWLLDAATRESFAVSWIGNFEPV